MFLVSDTIFRVRSTVVILNMKSVKRHLTENHTSMPLLTVMKQSL